MRILITGVNGFIGSNMLEYLHRKHQSAEIYGLDLNPKVTHKNIFACNLNQKNKLKTILLDIRPDYILHIAGGRMQDQQQLMESNFTATQSLLQVIEDLSIKPRIVVPGSAAEYGKPLKGKRLLNEKDRCDPLSWYGFVKNMQSNLCVFYAHRGLHVMVGRIFNISGHASPAQFALGRFAQEIVRLEKCEEFILETADLSGKRDFLDIDDACSALWTLAKKGKSGQVYNICSGKSMLMRNLLKEMLRLSKKKNIVLQENTKRYSESYDVVGSNAKITRDTKWKPKVSMTNSLKRTLEYYRR